MARLIDTITVRIRLDGPLMLVKRSEVISLWSLVVLLCVLGLLCGPLVYKQGVSEGAARASSAARLQARTAVTLARTEVEAEMRAACSPWYTDSRAKKPGYMVVCRAPLFMNAPIKANDIKNSTVK
jgi:hypothetical protein